MRLLWRHYREQLSVRRLHTLTRQARQAEALEPLDDLKPALCEALRPFTGGETEAKAVTVKLLNLAAADLCHRARSPYVAARPVGLVLDVSNSCQLTCPGCVHSPGAQGVFAWQPGLLNSERFARLLTLYGPTATNLTLSNYGEPTVNRQTPALVREAKRYLLRCTFSTNLALPKIDADAYVDSGLDFMTISADGATQQTYERFRRGGDLSLVLANLRRLVEAKRRLGRTAPVLCWRYLIFEHNRHEVEQARGMARDLGLDQFQAQPAWDVSWDDPGVRVADAAPVLDSFHSIWEILSKNFNPFPADAADAAIEEAYARPFGGARLPLAGAGPTCQWLYRNLTMDAGGRVLPCCASPRKDGELVFARIEDADPFNSARYQSVRTNLPQASRADNSYCYDCTYDWNADPDPTQLRDYFAAATRGQLDIASPH